MANQKKTKTTDKTAKKTSKTKVYIAPHKIIILCTAIITVCMGLLLITTLMSKPNKGKKTGDNITKIETPVVTPEQPSVSYENNIEDNVLSTQDTVINTNDYPVTEENSSEIPVTENVPNKEETVQREENKNEDNNKEHAENEPETKAIDFPGAVNNAQLVFVFDDGGHNINQTKAFIDLPFPFTMAVLPKLKYSKDSAELVRKSGNEVILHQPMQALNMNVNPGPGAITPTMDENQIISTLFQNITEIGPIAGMNNHEGSAITADPDKMAVILRFASQEGIYFLDSRTNADTAVPYVAGELGYSYYERNIFLDNEKTRENILTELKKGLNIANRNGSVIMIGHVWSADILPGILKEIYPELHNKGYTFSVVSKSKAVK